MEIVITKIIFWIENKYNRLIRVNYTHCMISLGLIAHTLCRAINKMSVTPISVVNLIRFCVGLGHWGNFQNCAGVGLGRPNASPQRPYAPMPQRKFTTLTPISGSNYKRSAFYDQFSVGMIFISFWPFPAIHRPCLKIRVESYVLSKWLRTRVKL